MGVMDKFLNYMKLNDEEDDYLDDDYLDDEEEEAPLPRKPMAKGRNTREEIEEEEKPTKKANQPKITGSLLDRFVFLWCLDR